MKTTTTTTSPRRMPRDTHVQAKRAQAKRAAQDERPLTTRAALIAAGVIKPREVK